MSVRSKEGPRRARRHSFTSLEEVARTIEASGGSNAQTSDVRKRSRSPCAEGRAGSTAKRPATGDAPLLGSSGDDYLSLPTGAFIYLFIFVVGGACARDRPRIRNDSLVLCAPGAKTVHLTADESHRPGAMPVNGGSGNRNEPSNQIPFPPSFFF